MFSTTNADDAIESRVLLGQRLSQIGGPDGLTLDPPVLVEHVRRLYVDDATLVEITGWLPSLADGGLMFTVAVEQGTTLGFES